jgi:uncharacterized repeat protein (TIGR03803 family)
MKKLLFIFSIAFCGITNAQITKLFDFSNSGGANPYGGLISSGNMFFGMTYSGGAKGDGDVFSIKTDGSGFKDILDFNGANGSNPRGSLIISGNVLYGMTELGGAYSKGLIFSVDTDGKGYNDILDFNGTNGSEPWGSLTLSGNKLFGATESGGTYEDGVIFSIKTDGSYYKTLFNFNGTLGQSPYCTLTHSGKVLFGTTWGCPGVFCTQSYGNVFSVDTDGTDFKVLLNFNNGSGEYGGYSFGSLSISENILYGMTYGGGTNSLGVLFSIDTSGTGYKAMVNFDTGNGANPRGDLFLSGSELYGMTYSGGANNDGLLFKISTNGSGFKDLYDFNSSNGANPCFGSLCMSGNTIYGMTEGGGANYDGIIFRYDSLITGLSQNNMINTQISIFPNPSAGNITIDLNGKSEPKNTFVSIYDVQGNLIVQKPLIQDKSEIDIHQFQSGVYIVKISYNETLVNKILIKY